MFNFSSLLQITDRNGNHCLLFKSWIIIVQRFFRIQNWKLETKTDWLHRLFANNFHNKTVEYIQLEHWFKFFVVNKLTSLTAFSFDRSSTSNFSYFLEKKTYQRWIFVNKKEINFWWVSFKYFEVFLFTTLCLWKRSIYKNIP